VEHRRGPRFAGAGTPGRAPGFPELVNTPVLSDGVIELTVFRLDDIEAHMEGEDEESIRWLTDGRRSTVETTTAWVQRHLEWWNTGGPRRLLAIREKRTASLAGMVEANLDNAWCGFPPGVVNLSYQVYPWARGRGYATRAVELVCRLLPSFDHVAIAAIRVQGGNIASRRVAEKAGFGDCGWIITPDGDRLRLFQRELPSPEDPTAATAQGRP
jgi:RimJ/RimL family protein N-acetyltransferase